MENPILLITVSVLIVLIFYMFCYESTNKLMIMQLKEKSIEAQYLQEQSQAENNTLNDLADHPMARGQTPDAGEINNQNLWLTEYSQSGNADLNNGIETPLKPSRCEAARDFASNNHLFSRFGTLAKY